MSDENKNLKITIIILLLIMTIVTYSLFNHKNSQCNVSLEALNNVLEETYELPYFNEQMTIKTAINLYNTYKPVSEQFALNQLKKVITCR